MEQEVPVIIQSGEPKEPAKTSQQETSIPDQVKEIGETLSEIFARLRESESYDKLLEGVETAKEYVRKYPAKALLYTLGAGAFFGLLIRKKR
ncbi:hypothetical protein [Chlorobium ferrooxidans]|uniref:DUF883 domain-containing protein n=1 Tax=Chlorobium ferrooxidans DSM 13031 TaxID=377431 RepID=Q0YRZ2_9CHLB|nr:hypothetical protein [Chlorobium ferrooxidans]EAT59080.1 conserved hypothetical protein [Chlorobium ferrooxidans DSM 13031]